MRMGKYRLITYGLIEYETLGNSHITQFCICVARADGPGNGSGFARVPARWSSGLQPHHLSYEVSLFFCTDAWASVIHLHGLLEPDLCDTQLLRVGLRARKVLHGNTDELNTGVRATFHPPQLSGLLIEKEGVDMARLAVFDGTTG